MVKNPKSKKSNRSSQNVDNVLNIEKTTVLFCHLGPFRAKIIRANFFLEFWGPNGALYGLPLGPIGPYFPGLGK